MDSSPHPPGMFLEPTAINERYPQESWEPVVPRRWPAEEGTLHLVDPRLAEANGGG